MLDTATGQRRYRIGDYVVYRVGTYRQWGEIAGREHCQHCGAQVLVMANRDRLDDTAAPTLHAC